VWQWSAGDPIELLVGSQGGAVEAHRLGGDVEGGDEPQVVVAAGAWQSARPIGGWGLAGCIVAPAFSFEGFELAPPDWEPGLASAATTSG
jgi:predicted cupin superfamily sugar epimerase